MNNTIKISSADFIQVLSASAECIRKQASYIETLEGKVETMERRDSAEKLAHTMHHKGIDSDVPVEKLAERLEEMAAQEGAKFNNLRDAVELVGPDMGTKMAHLDNAEERSGVGSDDLNRYLMGQIG